MKNKTYRFAAVAAVLLALCLVFMAPVGAEEVTWVEVSAFDDLNSNLTAGKAVKLVSNIGSDSNPITGVITAGNGAMLDLNGYTIVAQDTITTNYQFINVPYGVTFTLTDSSTGESGKITVSATTNNGWSRYSAVIAVQKGTAIINGGTLQHLGGTDMAYGVDVLTNGGENQDAKLVVNGGTIKSVYRGIRLFENGDKSTCILEVTGGSISGDNVGIWLQSPNKNNNKCDVTISGGSVSGGDGGAIYVFTTSGSSSSSAQSLKITGGTLTSTSSAGTIQTRNILADYNIEISPSAEILNTGNGPAIADRDGLSVPVKVTRTEDGTQNNPYTIGSKKELELFAAEVNGGNSFSGKYVKLTADIDLNNEEWTPIGVDSNLFKGHFDGNDKTISNLKISSGSYVGLFGHVNDASVTITNLTINNVQITGTSWVGALAGYAQNTASITNCEITGTIKIEGNNNVGGLTGQTYKGTIQSCTVIGNDDSYVKGTYATDKEGTKIGGLIGHAGDSSSTIIIDCHTDINVIGIRGVGGLLGYIGPLVANSGAKIEDCSSAGPVTLSYQPDYSNTLDSGKINAGALIGEVRPGSSAVPIKDSTSTSTINVDSAFEDIADKISVGFIGAIRGDTYNTDELVNTLSSSIETSSWEVSPENYNELVEKRYIKLGTDDIPVDVKIWEISVDENNGDFGEVTEGYTSVPEAKTFTITNTGNQIVSLSQIVSSKFTVTGLPVVISPKGTASITIQPNLELGVDTHSETLVISDAVNSTAKIEITVTFKVNEKPVEPTDDTTPSSGSGKDTGSGNFQFYPRSVPADGIIDFGTSPVVAGMELPVGSTGTVTLNTKPTFAMPENGFYAFEIDAPGYNLEAKINGAISFKLTVAEIEAAGWTVKDVVLFHGTVAEDGKIAWEALPTNLVKNENGIAYYKSAINGCSPFYIGFVKDGSIVNTEVVDPVTPPTDTPDVPGTDLPEIPPVDDEPETPATPAPLAAVLVALGAAVVLRRK